MHQRARRNIKKVINKNTLINSLEYNKNMTVKTPNENIIKSMTRAIQDCFSNQKKDEKTNQITKLRDKEREKENKTKDNKDPGADGLVIGNIKKGGPSPKNSF